MCGTGADTNDCHDTLSMLAKIFQCVVPLSKPYGDLLANKECLVLPNLEASLLSCQETSIYSEKLGSGASRGISTRKS